MRILFSGDIVGSPGRRAFARYVQQRRSGGRIHLVAANAENTAGGRGITPPLAEELFKAGADVLTLGDHAWDQKDIIPLLDHEPRLLRPANFPPGAAGHGFTEIQTRQGPVVFINLLGRVFLPPLADCPFRTCDAILAQLADRARVIIVDFHAEATSEKIALGRYLDGRVSAVLGTHTHVQTADDHVLPGGTAYMTDVGMTGPLDSVLGRDAESVLHKFLTGMPHRFRVAAGNVTFQGVILDIDPRTGKARRITRISEAIAPT